jgi:flagella synthesis protein FlgN
MIAPADWLDEGTAQAERLLAILRQERAALQQRRAPEIESIVGEKQRLITALEQHVRTAGSALRAAGLPASREGMTRWLRSHNDPRIEQRWQRFEHLSLECRQENLLNGSLVENARRAASQALALLRGDSAPSAVYGPGGTTASAGGSRLIAAI